MRSSIRRSLRGLAVISATATALVAGSTGPVGATGIGDTMIVRIDPYVGSEVALQAWGYGDGSGEGAEVVSSSDWRNAPSQRWKLTLRSFASDGSWNVTFESLYAYSGGKKCMTATQSQQVLLSTCASKATQIFNIKKTNDDPEGDIFEFYNRYFNSSAALQTWKIPYRLGIGYALGYGDAFQIRPL